MPTARSRLSKAQSSFILNTEAQSSFILNTETQRHRVLFLSFLEETENTVTFLKLNNFPLCLRVSVFNKKSLFLKMLIILHRLPIAAPSEPIFAEEAVAEVAPGYIVFKLAVAVEIGSACRRLYDCLTATQCLCIGVIERIDVDSHTHPVFRHLAGIRYEAEIE